MDVSTKQTTLRYSEPLLREAVRVFCFRAVVRTLGVRFFLVLGVVIACAAFLIARHERSWVVPFLLSTVAFVALLMASIYVAHHRSTLGRFRRMRTPEAVLSCSEEHLTMASELGSSTVPWSAITEIWRHPRFWLLLFSGNQFVTLPADCLDEDTKAFIARKSGC